GDSSLNEMIEDISAGVLIQKVDFGMEDPIRGGIQFNCHTGFLIENGEKTQRVKGISLSGDALSLLNSIDAVSKGPKDFQGFLSRKGREDIIPISFGGVYVRAKDALIGPN
ncbi:MAG: metallopeptidase TldD-related protein, partial [Promethearchaeota archaeon]